MEPEIFKPFGPSIVKISIPEDIISAMNSYVEEIIKDKEKLKENDEGHKLAGNVYQEFLLDTDFMKNIKWANFLGLICEKWVWREKAVKLKKFQIIKSWIVRQFKNEYNPIHYHSGNISGVGYLKVPSSMGDTLQKNKTINNNGKLILIDGSKKMFCSPTYAITPKVGDFYLFPSYLMHTVYPFSDNHEERRSVSFNAIIDEQSSML
tara:strand:- start:30 stop:650 length:621 start_codon:yes stop_codon:yes gene_type:complete